MRHMDATRRGDASEFLLAAGAEAIPHPGGSLFAHLQRTAAKVATWGGSPALQLAGLCHALYGTDGFPRTLLDPSSREQGVKLLGEGVEEIVYRYGSCDRDYTYPRLAGDAAVARFRDRFTGHVSTPSVAALRDFVELTFANELDIAQQNPDFLKEHGHGLTELFRSLEQHASDAARAEFRAVCSDFF
jgi:hypothetical protein